VIPFVRTAPSLYGNPAVVATCGAARGKISLKPRSTLPGSGSRFTSATRGAYGIAEIREGVSTLRLDRIGVGILAAQDEN
jgi:hypothetical protein